MYWINGEYVFNPQNKLLWCRDVLVAKGNEAVELKKVLDETGDVWYPVNRKPVLGGVDIRESYAELQLERAALAFQDKRWDLPARNRYDQHRNVELRLEDEWVE